MYGIAPILNVGILRRSEMNKKRKLEYCLGCENDFYNEKNSLGINECWSLKDTDKPILRKRVHINETPPWNGKPERLFKCFHQKQYIFVDPKRYD